MAKKALPHLCSALWLALAPGCGDDEGAGTSATQATTNSTPACPTDSCATTGDPTTGDPTTDAGPTTTATTTTTTGDATTTGSTTGEPLECRFAPGCHKPAAPGSDRGLASDVPIGCDGPSFSAGWSASVANYADPEAPRSIPMLADLDGDGHRDLFINMRKASAALVFRGMGDGNFDANPAATLTGGLFSGGWGGDLGDIDGDGDLDVLVGDHVRGAYAWLNGPGLVFSEAIAGLPPSSVLFSGGGLADLDGDGVLDAIFGADQFSKSYRTFRGAGGSWTEISGPDSAKAMNVGHFQFADYDGDGDLDVFAFGEGSAVALDVYVYRNDGASFVEVANLPAGAPEQINADPVQGSVADINCDGALDIAAGGAIFLGQGGSWSLAAQVDNAHIGHLADMNGDGHLDLVTHDPTVGLALYHGDGTGTGFAPAAVGLPDASYTYQGVAMDTAYGIDVADVGGESALDIVRVAGFGAQFALEVYVR